MSRKTLPKTKCCYGLFFVIRDNRGMIINLFCSTCKTLMDLDGKAIEPKQKAPSGNNQVLTNEIKKDINA